MNGIPPYQSLDLCNANQPSMWKEEGRNSHNGQHLVLKISHKHEIENPKIYSIHIEWNVLRIMNPHGDSNTHKGKEQWAQKW